MGLLGAIDANLSRRLHRRGVVGFEVSPRGGPRPVQSAHPIPVMALTKGHTPREILLAHHHASPV